MTTRTNARPYILAVDNENELLMLTKSLVSQDFEVATVVSAEDLWASLKSRHPDFIFLDSRMNEINADGICTRLKQDSATAVIPVILFSASQNIAEVAKTCGADGFISKPYSTEKIISEITRILLNQVHRGGARKNLVDNGNTFLN